MKAANVAIRRNRSLTSDNRGPYGVGAFAEGFGSFGTCLGCPINLGLIIERRTAVATAPHAWQQGAVEHEPMELIARPPRTIKSPSRPQRGAAQPGEGCT